MAKIAAWALAAGLIAGCLGAPGARAGGTIQTLASFSGANGEYPTAGLIDVSGTLYGTTNNGGGSSAGTLFSYSATNGLQTLVSFSGANGANPGAGLIDVSGTLYGTTVSGGSSGYGTLFSYSLSPPASVPEPSAALVMLVGLTGLIGMRRKRPLISARTGSPGRLSALDRVRKPHPVTMPAPAGAPRSWG